LVKGVVFYADLQDLAGLTEDFRFNYLYSDEELRELAGQ
jgi:hypothetical protein